MALQMTRAEYEAKYGKPPSPPKTSFDVTPAPIRMTRAEYTQQFGYTPGVSNKPQTQGYLGRIGTAFSDSADIAANSFKTGATNIAEDWKGFANDETRNPIQALAHFFSALGHTAGNIAGTAAGVGLAAAKDIAAPLSQIETPEGDTIGQRFAGGAMQFADNLKTGMNVDHPEVIKAWEGLPPDLQKSVVDVLNTTGLVGGGKILGTPVGSAREALTELKTGAVEAYDATKQAAQTYKDSRAVKTIAQREKDLYDIETNYAKTRDAMDYSKDAGAASRQRIASTDVLAGAVDENGVIRTTQKGGPVDLYKAQTIDGAENVVRQNLEREGATVNLKEVLKYLDREIHATKQLQGADLVTALNGARKEIKGLSLGADEFGNIPVVKAHDAKIATTGHVKSNTPPEVATYRKAVARAYKTLVEDKSSLNVKQVNTELGKYYEDITRLEALDGKRVKGGRLGKHFAQISGNIVGGLAGSVGGAPGAALGSVLGGEISTLLKGKAMARSFGKAHGLQAPENAILKAAKERGALPKQRDLSKPDAPVGAAKGIPKTKEIHALEKQIRENVAAQKAAIAAKDTTLVAKLKDIYDHLVEKLKAAIKVIKTEGQRGFAKNPFASSGGKRTATPQGKTGQKSSPGSVPRKQPFTQEQIASATDDFKEYALDQFDEAIRKGDIIDLDLEAEIKGFVKHLKNAKSPNMEDIRDANDYLRKAQLKPKNIADLLEDLDKQPRDPATQRWLPKKKVGSPPQSATKRNGPNGDNKASPATSKAWPTTASKPSKAGSTSTGSAPTGKEGVSAQKADTSGPFEGVKVYKGLANDKTDNPLGAFTTDKAHAEGWAGRQKNGGTVVERTIKADARLAPFDEYHAKFNELKTESATDSYFKAQGYDGVDFRNSPTMKGVTEKEIRIWNADKLSSPSIPKELEPLAAEARKYKTAEEFSDAMSTNYAKAQGDYSISPLDMANEIDGGYWEKITNVPSEERNYALGEGSNFYTPIRGDKITIYRATVGDRIRAGDYVTTSRAYAESHLNSAMGGKGKVLSKEIDVEELFTNGAAHEFLYGPKWVQQFKSKQSLIDFFNRVKGGK